METITLNDERILERVENYPIGKVICDYQEHKEKIFNKSSWLMAEDMIKTLSAMYEWTKEELKNRFTIEEVWCIIRAFHSMSYSPDTMKPKELLAQQIENCFICEPHDEKSKIGINSVQEKIKVLTQFQAYTLIMLYYEFLNNHSGFTITDDEIKKAFLIED